MTYYNLTKLAEEKSDKNKQSLLSSPKTHMGLGGLALAGSALDAYKNNEMRKFEHSISSMLADMKKNESISNPSKAEYWKKSDIDDRNRIRKESNLIDRIISGGIKDTEGSFEYRKRLMERKINLGRAIGASGAAGLGYGLYKHLKNKDK